jgi:hypothetical protein
MNQAIDSNQRALGQTTPYAWSMAEMAAAGDEKVI